MSHTPGPWSAQGRLITGPNYEAIATCALQVQLPKSQSEAATEANANLISNAPAMLAKNHALHTVVFESAEALRVAYEFVRENTQCRGSDSCVCNDHCLLQLLDMALSNAKKAMEPQA